MDGMRSMEQRWGREFNGEVITVGCCATFVTDCDFVAGIFIVTDWIFGTEFDLCSDSVLSIANRPAITHGGADFITSAGLVIHFAYGFFDPRVIVFVGGHCGGK